MSMVGARLKKLERHKIKEDVAEKIYYRELLQSTKNEYAIFIEEFESTLDDDDLTFWRDIFHVFDGEPDDVVGREQDFFSRLNTQQMLLWLRFWEMLIAAEKD
jgi:hypothetical protein